MQTCSRSERDSWISAINTCARQSAGSEVACVYSTDDISWRMLSPLCMYTCVFVIFASSLSVHKQHDTYFIRSETGRCRLWIVCQTRSIWKMLGPFATASRCTPPNFTLPFTRCRYCRTPPAHRCPQQQRQRVTEGTAMAP